MIDLGPGPSREGGELVYAGAVAGLAAEPRSGHRSLPPGRDAGGGPPVRREPDRKRLLRIRGARENNLKDLTLDVPLAGSSA